MKIQQYIDFIEYLKTHNFLSSKGILKNPSRTKEGVLNYLKVKEMLEKITLFAEGLTSNQRMRLLHHDIISKNYFCPVCDNPRNYNTSVSKWFLTCNTKDADHANYIKKEAKVNHEKTMISKYGVKAPSQIPEVLKKMQSTCLSRYGTENPTYISKKIPTREEMLTFLDIYGVPKYNLFCSETGTSRSFFYTLMKKYNLSWTDPRHLKNNILLKMLDDNTLFLNGKINYIKTKQLMSNSTVYTFINKYDLSYKKIIKSSIPEQEIVDFIKSLDKNIEVISNTRKIISPKELDIYLPEYNLAIEYNGLMFHSQGINKSLLFNTPNKDKNMHLKKTEACEKQGIELLHINENEWLNTDLKDIWKSVIQNKLKKNKIKIGARNCQFATTAQLDALSKEFLEKNHLQQSGAIGSIRYGLMYNNELVSLMTFSKSRFSKADYELVRFCNKKGLNNRGAAQRLLKAFQKEHPYKSIVSYANRRWSDGALYRTLNFSLLNISSPNYYYFKDASKLWHRANFQKHKLEKKLDVFNKELPEHINMFNNGYRRIFDAGNFVYVLNEAQEM